MSERQRALLALAFVVATLTGCGSSQHERDCRTVQAALAQQHQVKMSVTTWKSERKAMRVQLPKLRAALAATKEFYARQALPDIDAELKAVKANDETRYTAAEVVLNQDLVHLLGTCGGSQ